MEPTPALKLVKDKPLEDVGPYKFNRRSAPRWTSAGRVTAVVYNNASDSKADRNRDTLDTAGLGKITTLQMLDQSPRGAGCWSQEPLHIGSKVVMFFPPHGPERGFDVVGQVVRCEKDANAGYHVGVSLEASATVAA